MFDAEQINGMMNVLSGLGLVDIKDQESLIDGNSVALLTAKVNAMASVLLKDKPQEVKDEFIQMWKSEYQDLISRKHGMVNKVFNMPEIVTAIGIDESDLATIKDHMTENMNSMKDVIQKATDGVIQSIDTYVI